MSTKLLLGADEEMVPVAGHALDAERQLQQPVQAVRVVHSSRLSSAILPRIQYRIKKSAKWFITNPRKKTYKSTFYNIFKASEMEQNIYATETINVIYSENGKCMYNMLHLLCLFISFLLLLHQAELRLCQLFVIPPLK